MFNVLSLFLLFAQTVAFRVVGWFNGEYADVKNIPWNYYTHIVTGDPILYDNGTVECNLNDTLTQTIVDLAHKHNRLVQWKSKFIYGSPIFNNTDTYKVDNYINSLPLALKQCNIDGVEFDYEWGYKLLDKMGIILPYYSNKYTDFLTNVKRAVGEDHIVSIDMGSPGCCCVSCGYPLEFLPWVNVTRFNNGAFDFINSMDYFYSKDGNIDRWKNAKYHYETLWGFNLSKINLGIPYFSMNTTFNHINNEPIWSTLSKSCPNIEPDINVCEKIPFVGKQMNYDLGVYAKQNVGGAFPWTINFDSFENNNTLINWFMKGVNEVEV